MRLCGVLCLVLVLVLTVLCVQGNQQNSKEKHYYIAAVEIDWNYTGNQTNRFGSTYKKVVFREYEKGFRQAKTHPSNLGLLGPTLRAEEGETLVVTFRNMATGVYSIHPHGIAYGKQSEGANYFDNTSQKEKEDDVVRPNSEHVYYWEVTSDVAPQKNDPSCLTYTYVSHQNVVEDYNSGLIGTLLICKPGSLDESGNQARFHEEHVFLLGVFDEKRSKYKPNTYEPDNHVKYTINGYTQGSLPDVSICAYASVSLHLVGMSSEPEVFSVHMNGQVLQQNGHKVSSVGLISGSSATASMVALHPGRWLLSSHTTKHMEVGLHGFVDVKTCEGFEAPHRRMTHQQKRQSREWKYYIAAEEIVWDYAPNLPEHADEDFKLQYLTQSSTRIGQRYKKAVYTMYKNESFTERSEILQRKNELGILGPVIRAQIRDVIKIIFKNKASRPYSIYPHGLTFEKLEEGANYPEGGNHSHAVQPGETHTYVWRVVEEDEPLDRDSRCLTRMYHSAVDTPRDIASGLIGPILICKSESLNVRNVQLRADKEQHAVFAVFDENKSWYMDDNIRQYSDRSRVNKADPDFYRSNVMHTVNGYVYESGPVLGFCYGEVATWHVSSIGAQDYIQTATFYGHKFELNERKEDILSLFPMTGETISMDMDNTGIWLFGSFGMHETTKGMRVKFQDVECFRDFQYEYNDYEEPLGGKEYITWKPVSLDDIKKEEEKKKELAKEETAAELDYYTALFADELGLRSLKNQTADSDVEQIDLSFLDYDIVDAGAITKDTQNKNETTSKPDPQVDAQNHTSIKFMNQSDTVNTQNSSVSSGFDSFSEYKIGNVTISSLNISLESTTVNDSSPEVLSNFNNVTSSSDSENTTLPNATSILMAGNVSTESPSLTVTETTNLTEKLARNLYSILGVKGKNATVINGTQTSVSNIVKEDSEEILTRGDVFFYSAPVDSPKTPEGNESVQERLNKTSTSHVNISAATTNQSVSTPRANITVVSISSNETRNLTLELKVESTSNKTNVTDLPQTATKLEYHHQNVSSGDEITSVNSSLDTLKTENITYSTQLNSSVQNVTVELFTSNSSKEVNYESRSNVTTLPGELNHTTSVENVTSETTMLNVPISSDPVTWSSSEELGGSESSEEVFIYLQENKTEAIKTTSIKTQEESWTYDATHQMVPNEIPDHILKYIKKDEVQTTPIPKKTPKVKKVTLRHRPLKGQGMKTRRRKEYVPQSRSGLPFSPRGFNPGMAPRGSRPLPPQPISDEEDLINQAIVIGVPRPDFSDYELYVPGDDPDHIGPDVHDVKADEYEYVSYKDPYSSHEDIKNLNLDLTSKHYSQLSGPNVKTYFIAAEKVEWDYAGYGRRQDKSLQNTGDTKFTKVVFRGYLDSSFTTPDIRGETEEHLGILGPVIKAEVGQSIMVVFRNNADRPFSLHPNGVSYTKNMEGLKYDDGSRYWYQYDNEVLPNGNYTYMWNVNSAAGPMPGESDCRTWAYYSGVNPERDIHSGLIGPLLVCRQGTLSKPTTNIREFTLLFMTFDESQSWYYEKNLEMLQRKTRRRMVGPSVKESFKFHSINGIIYSLKGLRMYTNQLVQWHLINMGSPKDFQSVHFHGQTFLHKKTNSYRQAVFPLLPGSFATLEMYPSKPGLWQLETEVGLNQQKGMQTLLLILDDDCYHPLGLESGSVKDDQITAFNTRGYWEPHLARLNNQGKYNAWSTEQNHSWIQVDFQRPVVVSQVAIQGAKQLFQSQFVERFFVSYSNDRRKWVYYKGDDKSFRKLFSGNQEAYETKTNTFFPPLVARFIRLHPTDWYNKATLRMELYGCELDGCSVPLGMESGLIEDRYITASSIASSWYSGPWKPSLARLNKQGTINAWQAKFGNMKQWLQIELPQVKKITGIVTQGAKSLGKEMYVMSYSLQFSNDGTHWIDYSEDEGRPFKTFTGNINNNDHVKNYIYPPIFSRFIRILPVSWMYSITMRVELLGCDFE
ncbi:coagulation factor V [Sphaeramia orbicularis]|uniref:coagulation factor V n=1 Tax=Sphaeramia orbicularis TaxID=375764 RepID=UPI00117FAB3D|nr:coagulation factor V [Sphaeramia orbicularis]